MQFGFEQLDELAFAVSLKGKFERPTTGLQATNLGTIIELRRLVHAGIPLPRLNELVDTGRVRLVRAIEGGERNAIFESHEGCASLISCHWQKDEEPDDWYNFCASMQKATMLAGIQRKNAQELVAATREMVSNIFDHSGASTSGIAGFSVTSNELEIVVADSGIGVLQSLRTSPEFQSLRDSGEALQAALTDGTSRFGRLSGHGGGFRDLFRGLLNLSSALRFRSGDHALSINGISPGLASARVSQKVPLPGFIVSITCNTRSLT
jgi:hypothetical protein